MTESQWGRAGSCGSRQTPASPAQDWSTPTDECQEQAGAGSTSRRRITVSAESASIAVALIVALASTTGAVAGSLVTGRQIADGTITTKDVKDKTIAARDLAPSVTARLGGPGAAGPAGPGGAGGPAGAAGAQGPRGFSAWDTIPSGITITAPLERAAAAANLGGEAAALLGGEEVVLPGRAPAALRREDLLFAPHPDADPAQVDTRCSGDMHHPTSPAGKVCIYLGSVLARNGATVTAATSTLPDRGFVVGLLGPGPNGFSLQGTWAYTAP